MTEAIQFGSRTIDFILEYADRKSLSITVTPEMKVLVKAPTNSSVDKVKATVRRKAPWIIKQQGFFLSFQPRTPKRRFLNGETHLYLGRQYRLKVIHADQESIKLRGGFIEVSVKKVQHTEKVLSTWYLQQAQVKFDDFAAPLISRFERYRVKPTGMVVRKMATRWGSCTPKGKIILNPDLIRSPRRCIEYVIIHELCHLVHRDHTKKFLELQAREMKDWERWKMKLEQITL